MKNKFYIHPILYAILPTIILYSHNIREAWPILLFKPLLYSVLFAFASWLVFLLFLGKKEKASIITSVWLILFFSYGHVFLFLAHKGLFELLPIGPHFLLLSLYLGILLAVYLALFLYKKSVGIATAFLNVASLSLLLMNLIPLIPFEVQRVVASGRLQNHMEVQQLLTAQYTNTDQSTYPDIYYFVFDRYPNQSIAQEYFKYDNSSFIDFLDDADFYVASKSASNYPSSYQSLSSSLNMSHLTFLSEILGENYSDQTVVYRELLDTALVPQFLVEKGYQYYHLGSSWEPTKKNVSATQNYNLFLNFNEFEAFLYENTFANAVLGKINGQSLFTGVEILNIHQKNVPYKIEKIKELASQESPKFIFSHFLLPHPPYLFDANCMPLTFEAVRKRPDETAYIDQVSCASKTMEEFTQVILREAVENNPHRPVVIIFQSDEGPYLPLEYFNDTQYVTSENNDAYKIHSRILNALYFSDKNSAEAVAPYEELGFSQDQTPVNTFRLLFNYYFGTQFDLLENKTYIFESNERPYHFIEITDLIW